MSDSGTGDPSVADNPRPSLGKPHPSEYLEFVTVSSQQGAPRLESLKGAPQPDNDDGASRINVTSSNDDLFRGLSAAIPGLRRLSAEARAATKAEHSMTFVRGCRLYPKAMLWSLLLSMTIVQEGYDLTLINSFFAFPIFRRSYGVPPDQGNPQNQQNYQISPAWQSGLTNAAVSGEILGLMFNGFLTDRFGYRKTMIVTLIWISLFVFLAFFAINIQMLLAAQILCGLPWYVTPKIRCSLANWFSGAYSKL